jgi:hypothetical protein
MAEHTPAPWTIDTDGGIEDCEWHGWDINGKTKQRGGELDTICMVLATENTRSEYTMTAENEANARLIAMAPELLEALERLVESIALIPYDRGEGIGYEIPWGQAETAIANAKGGR